MRYYIKRNQKEIADVFVACSNLLSSHGYMVEEEKRSSRINFSRKISNSGDRLMPVKELLRGFCEGQILFNQDEYYFIMNIKYIWHKQVFVSILLVITILFVVYLLNGLTYSLSMLFVPLFIILLTLIGFKSVKLDIERVVKELKK